MQMDVEFEKEQIDTLFVWLGPVVGFLGSGWWVKGVRPRNYTCLPSDFFLASWLSGLFRLRIFHPKHSRIIRDFYRPLKYPFHE